MSKLIDAGREVLGTCREAKENFDYDQLVKKYDKHTADMLISEQLNKGGISIDEFNVYKKVKVFVQHGGLDVSEAVKEAENKAVSVISNVLPA
ncbi:MAG: hypothetical protein Q8Q50_08940 [Methylobacter sp.]|nr:hypothetical protein [Methylobacter sp.]